MKEYMSPRGWYRLSFPNNWTLGVEDEKNVILYEPGSGIGTLRVTAIRPEGAPPFNADEFLEQHRRKHNAAWVNLGDMRAVYYTEESIERAEKVVTHHWLVGKGRLIILASFALPEGPSRSEAGRKELDLTIGTLRSIVFLSE
jgi:hypothetical protein